MRNFGRNCDDCGNWLVLTNKTYYNIKNKPKHFCRSCSQKGKSAWNKGLTKDTDKRVENNINKAKESWRINPRTPWNKGKTAEQDERIKLNTRKCGDTLIKRYNNNEIVNPMTGKKHKKETIEIIRQKIKEISKNRIGKFGGMRDFNDRASKIFQEIEEKFKWDGFYLPKNYEYCVCGYYTDYYNPKINLVIEFDEKHHKKPKQKEKDISRQKIIEEKLHCKVIRIREYENDNWEDLLKEYEN
jgi:very-short-patch-repair endonuclease